MNEKEQDTTQELIETVQPISEAAEDFKEENYKYIAFISYRHIEPDATIAAKIHTMIETFQVPKEFYIDGKKPQFRVFRDREELTTSSLNDSLDEALRSSKFLIVICSKRLPLSAWCQKEVQTFKELHGIDRIIPVLIEGEPQQSFPDALLNQDKEILAAELRTDDVQRPDFKGYAVIEKEEPAYLKELTTKTINLLKTEKYRIMAAILGVTYGDLKQRDKERRNRMLLRLSAVGLVFMTIFGAIMLNAYRNENAAKRQTIQSRSAMLLQKSTELLKQGDKVKSLIVADKAMSDVDDKMEMYPQLVAKHTGILNDSIYYQGASPISIIKTDNTFTFLDINEKNQHFAAGLKNKLVGLWNINTGQLVTSNEVHVEQAKVIQYSKDGQKLYTGGFDDRVVVLDAKTLKLNKALSLPGNIMYIEETYDSKYLVVLVQQVYNYVLRVFDTTNYEPVGKDLILKPNLSKVSLSPTDYTLITNFDTFHSDESMVLWDIIHKKVIFQYKDIPVKIMGSDDKEKIDKRPFIEARFSKDGQSIYARTSYYYMKLDRATGALKHIFNDQIIQTKQFVEEGDSLYVSDSIKIIRYNKGNGQWMAEYTLPETVERFVVKKDTIVVLLSSGKVSYIKDGVMLNGGIDFNQESANDTYLYLTEDASKLLYLSLQTQQIKIATLQEAKKDVQMDGQIAAVSHSNRYVLLYNTNDFMVYDTQTFKVVNQFNKSIFDFNGSYLTGNTFQISNDGKYVAANFTYRDDVKKVLLNRLEIYDIQNKTRLQRIDLKSSKIAFEFTPDSKQLVYLYHSGALNIQNVLNKEQSVSHQLPEGFVDSIVLDESSKYIAINYTYGNSKLVDLATGQELKQLGGEVLHFKRDHDKFEVTGVYNNFGFKWKEVDNSYQQIKLTDRRSEKGVTFGSKNSYNAEKDLLLTIIRVQNKESYAYLIDFKNGELLKSFEIDTPYFANGFIGVDGKHLIIDHSFVLKKKDDKDIFSSELSMNTSQVELLGYDELIKQSQSIVGSRKLNKDELVELGLDY